MNNLADHTQCPFAKKLAAYLADTLSARETLALEEHLLDCGDCKEAVSRLRRIENAFGTAALLARLQKKKPQTGSALSAVSQPIPASSTMAATVRALETAAGRAEHSDDAARSSRLRNWVRRLACHAQEFSEKISGASACLESLQTASINLMQEAGCVWLQRIDLTAAVAGPVRDSSSSTPKNSRPSAVPPGVQIRIEPVPGSSDVEVIANGLPANAGQLIALLIPKDAPEKAKEATLREVSDNEWSARFENAIPGEYVVAIEPLLNR